MRRGPKLWLSLALLPILGLPRDAVAASTEDGRETVVLLHGLGRSPRSMQRLGRRLEAEGYRVVNVAYESRRETVEEASRHLGAELARCCPERSARVHFVTHSLGSIVVRYYLAHNRPKNLGRVVMLGPPNNGSELVDLMKRLPVIRRHVGPSRSQLGTDASSLPVRLGPVHFELGVIAGTRTWNPLFSWVLPGADDGMVAVERTKVEGMSDFLTVPRTHTFIMRGRDVIAQTIVFLQTGQFEHPP
jgi:triacylglycerol esterase/lipase EstA (alpha/beta hydrolase family)